MLKSVITVLVALFAISGAVSAATTTSEPAHKQTVKPRTGTSKSPTKAARASARTRVVRRSTQQAPTPERYREIQQALADKGYFQGPVNGSWNADSVDALKRFQKDQKLTDTGKLDSLSLIALGLGPKRSLSAGSTTESRPTDDNRRPEGSQRP